VFNTYSQLNTTKTQITTSILTLNTDISNGYLKNSNKLSSHKNTQNSDFNSPKGNNEYESTYETKIYTKKSLDLKDSK